MHETGVLLLELGAVLLSLGVLGRLARRLSMSPIPLYLLAGLAFGQGGLIPLDASDEFISIGAEIGILLLLLTLGLEYTAGELLGTLRTGLRPGLVDLVVNATPGAVAGVLLGWGPVAVVTLAGVTYVSSSGIAAKLLSDLGRLGNRETPTVLGLLVTEDLVMAVYLPALTTALAGVGLLAGGVSVAAAVAAVSLVLVVSLRYGEGLSKLFFSTDDEVLLLWVLGVTLLVAGVASQLQVSAAVGAFLVGIALSGNVATAARPLLAPVRDLFAGVFFVFFGLQTDPGDIPAVAATALLLGVVSAATKLGTGWWAARRAGIGPLGRARAGAVLVARGEFSIVIAGLAVAAGEDPRLGPFAAAYVLFLAVLGPLLTRYAEPLAARTLGYRLPH